MDYGFVVLPSNELIELKRDAVRYQFLKNAGLGHPVWSAWASAHTAADIDRLVDDVINGDADRGVESHRACKKCGGTMKRGKAIAQTWVGLPDFPCDKHPVTVSPGGRGKLTDCLKCEQCGWSVAWR